MRNDQRSTETQSWLVCNRQAIGIIKQQQLRKIGLNWNIVAASSHRNNTKHQNFYRYNIIQGIQNINSKYHEAFYHLHVKITLCKGQLHLIGAEKQKSKYLKLSSLCQLHQNGSLSQNISTG